jgi:hypothetical protein
LLGFAPVRYVEGEEVDHLQQELLLDVDVHFVQAQFRQLVVV